MATQKIAPKAWERVKATVRKTEDRPIREPREAGSKAAIGDVARFKLVTHLEPGTTAFARRLQRASLEDMEEGQFTWVPTGQDVPVYGFGGSGGYLAEGAEVTCAWSADGWCVIEGGETTALPPAADLKAIGIEKIEPFMVLPIRGLSPEYKYARQAWVDHTWGLVPDAAVWGYGFQVVAGVPSPSLEPHEDPDATAAEQKTRVTVSTVPLRGWEAPSPMIVSGGSEDNTRASYASASGPQVRCAYAPFDGLMSNGEPMPQVIKDRFGTEHPQGGQIWGPGVRYKLTHTFSALEMFWWEIRTGAEYHAASSVVHVWDPYHPSHAEYTGNSSLHFNQNLPQFNEVLVTHLDGLYPPVSLSFWVSDCGEVNSGVLASEPMPGPTSRFFVAPWGYWESSVWGEDGVWWFYQNYRYDSVNQWYGPYGGRGWFGNWGSWGYWSSYWGGFGPTADEALGQDSSPPEPPCGTLFQRHRFGFVLWEYGWRVANHGVDEEANTCVVGGPLEIRTDLVEEDTTMPLPTPVESE